MSEQYQLIFTDMLNQRHLGGKFFTFIEALLVARDITGIGYRSTFKIARVSDNVVLAQSKVTQS